jgi:hypothetical protein
LDFGLNKLTFKINASEHSNDHEIRILIDGTDWLDDAALGVDPVDFFRQRELFDGGNLLIGRCGCGCPGCADVSVNVELSVDKVFWITEKNEKLSFEREDYLKFVTAASTDFSWETLGRKAERLVSEIFIGKLIEDKYLFDWASSRFEPNMINLSFSAASEQKLYKFSWDGKTIDSALENARMFYRQNFIKG